LVKCRPGFVNALVLVLVRDSAPVFEDENEDEDEEEVSARMFKIRS
jgi:hypothetical protein